jgi:predicted N-acetyltransferase YhbS
MANTKKDMIEIRVLRKEDLPAIIKIDEKVSGMERADYYERKMEAMMDQKNTIATSLVAEYGGKVVGFIMGSVYTGEFGIPQKTASLDTVGIDPAFAKGGIGTQLMDEYLRHLKTAGVEYVQTLVDWNDVRLLRFFNKSGFVPSKTLNLELKL